MKWSRDKRRLTTRITRGRDPNMLRAE